MKMMRSGKLIVVLAIALVTVIMASGFASAQTLSYTASATSGNVMNGALDIVKIGAYPSGDYQYLFFETRSPGINNPGDGDIYEASIDIEANVDGSDVTEYVVVTLMWSNSGGNITKTYLYGMYSGSSSTLTDNDVTVSGNRVTVRLPQTIFSNADVMSVEYVVVQPGTMTGDKVTYSLSNPGGNGGSSNSDDSGTTSDTSYDNGDWAFLGLFGLGFACVIGIFIVWIILAIWAYKDAKKRCMSSPIIWFLVVFFLGIIGLIIYVIVRKDECQKQQAPVNMPPPPPTS